MARPMSKSSNQKGMMLIKRRAIMTPIKVALERRRVLVLVGWGLVGKVLKKVYKATGTKKRIPWMGLVLVKVTKTIPIMRW